MKAIGHASIVIATLGAGLAALPAFAAEETFLDRFRGSWSGSGRVQREGTSTPRQVNCSVTGQPGQNQLSFQGSCRAAIIFSRPIGASLTYDPPSGQYRGTYTGSAIGPAQLTGTPGTWLISGSIGRGL